MFWKKTVTGPYSRLFWYLKRAKFGREKSQLFFFVQQADVKGNISNLREGWSGWRRPSVLGVWGRARVPRAR